MKSLSFKSVATGGASLLVLTALSAGAPAALAQDAAPQDAEAPSRGMDVVTVTAQRREQDLQDVPLAVSAFSPEEIANRQIDEPIDLLEYVPNFFGGQNTGIGTANMYYIRGVGNSESIATFDPPVGTYVDEIYIARQNGNNVSFFDVEQIEVLRGPQGTLFGRNTTGGAVSIRMAKPAPEFGGYVEAEVGNYERALVRGSVDLPINENVLTKISAFALDEAGFVDNLATGETLNGQEAHGLRGDLRVFFGDDVTWDVSADYAYDTATNVLNYGRGRSVFGVEGPGGLTQSGDDRVANTGLSSCSAPGDRLEQALAGCGMGLENNSWSLTSNLGWDVTEQGRLNLILGWRGLEQDFTLDFFDGGLQGQQFDTGGLLIVNEGEHEQFSAELKYDVTLFDGAVDLVSGAYYFTEDNEVVLSDVFTLGTADSPTVLILGDRIVANDLHTAAVYAQGDWRFAERWTATVGARWTQETKSLALTELRDTSALAPDRVLSTENMVASGIPDELTKALITPRFALNYEHNDNLSVYASHTIGFKSGGWNAREVDPSTVLPFEREIATSTELGLRSVWLDGLMRLNATAFWVTAEDLQTPSSIVRADGSIGYITRNFADLKNSGLELDVTFTPVRALDLYASIGLQNAEYENLGQPILDQIAACQADPSQGNRGIVTPDCSVAEPVRAPDLTATVGASYTFDIPAWNALLTPSVNVRMVDETYVGTSNRPAGFEDGYTLVNTGARLQFEDSGWSAALECTNCTDEAYVTTVLSGTVYVSDPRRIALRLRRDF